MENNLESRTSMVLNNEVLKEIIENASGAPVFINGVPSQQAFSSDPAPAKKGSGIASVLFILYFIGTIIAAVVFSQTEPALCIAAVGSLFLVIGVVSLFQNGLSVENFMALVFPVIGLLMTVIPILYVYGKSHPEAIQIDRNACIRITLMGTALLGFVIAVMTPLSSLVARNRCSQPVTAKCIFRLFRFARSKRSVGAGRTYRLFNPVWQYEVDGAVYITSEGVYSGENVPEIFDEQTIFYQPGKPYNIVRPLKVAIFVPVIVGVAFVVFSVLALVLMNK